MGIPFGSELRRLVRLGALRFGGWPRRVLVVACLLLAALSAISAAQPATPGAAVVVASRDLPAGHVIVAGDVRVERWPAHQVPQRRLGSVRDAIGGRPATAVAAGEPLTSVRLIGAGLASGLPPGLVVVTVSLADPAAASLIHTGDQVDLVRGADASADAAAARAGPGSVIAHNVAVLAVLPTDQDRPPALAVSVDESTALKLAGLAGVPLIATLRSR